MDHEDWYEATSMGTSKTFKLAPGGSCVFRKDKGSYLVFDMDKTAVRMSADEAKTCLRSRRGLDDNLVRASDQGYINWKFKTIIEV